MPFEIVEMKLYREFGWTPQELESQSWEKIETFLNIMNLEKQFQDRNQRLENQKHGGR